MSAQVELTLPGPISAYFAADRQGPEAVARCFTAQAVVNDVGQMHTGTDEIKAWKAKADAKYTYTMMPFELERDGEFHIVRVHAAGTFEGSPIDMTLRFGFATGLIASLEISV
ncbi:hypothetical protein AWB77_04640 [Caballeronia fortuita]|uniref:Polyketide cyclase n=1 Tax=Caballeronia fortuita TaxID=1777138 RepID=A0A158CWV7_9BURK|nr:nuclear transport factor 2 family protein [Caballeronia fortuita]SAK86701.1 hypothetical protein AWB77_04640 [Caballeronia fortuita]